MRRAAAKGKNGFTMSHGQAGLASDFGTLCNMRMALGGVFAHVLPMTAAHADSWKRWRTELEKDFENIVAIANVAETELQSMSADTGMSEMLLVATRRSRRPSRWRPTSVLCVNLNAAPATLAQGYALAQEIAAVPEDSGEGLLQHGSYVRMAQTEAGFPWGAVGNSNNELAAVIAALLEGKAYDPTTLTTHQMAVPMTTLGEIAKHGPTHHVLGHVSGGDGRGAFEWTPLRTSRGAPAQSTLWAAYAKEQTTILSSPTHGGRVIDRKLARRMVQQRSRWFISRNLRWTSQAIAFANTRKLLHGGRAWNAIQDIDEKAGACLALFYNSIFGAIVRQAYGQSTQAGRATIQVGAVEGIPCPAFHSDTPAGERARGIAARHFDRLSELSLRPFAHCFQDPHRAEIDAVVADMLGLDSSAKPVVDMLTHYRLLFAREPNVNGRQKSILKSLQTEG